MCQRLFLNTALPRLRATCQKPTSAHPYLLSHSMEIKRHDLAVNSLRKLIIGDLTNLPSKVFKKKPNKHKKKRAAAAFMWHLYVHKVFCLCSLIHLSVCPHHQPHSAEPNETKPRSLKSQEIKLPPLWIKFDLSIIQVLKGSSHTGNLLNWRRCHDSGAQSYNFSPSMYFVSLKTFFKGRAEIMCSIFENVSMTRRLRLIWE